MNSANPRSRPLVLDPTDATQCHDTIRSSHYHRMTEDLCPSDTCSCGGWDEEAAGGYGVRFSTCGG